MSGSVALMVLENRGVDGTHRLALTSVLPPSCREGSDDVLVELHAAALNRRDHWITRELYPGVVYPWILGADGCGVVTHVGSTKFQHLLGKRVVLNASLHFDEPSHCLLGSFPAPGTFASEIVVPASQVYEAPAHLSDAEAAALPLAGLTAFSCVLAARVQTGDVVLVTGIGGGVASLALQFAAAMGAHVLVTSSSQAKIDKAVAMGAKGGVLYTAARWQAALLDLCPPEARISAVIDGSAGEAFNSYIRLLDTCGRIVCYGSTASTVSGELPRVDITRLFLKRASITGITMGSPSEFETMLQFVSAHKIVPVVDAVYKLEDHAAAFDKLACNTQFGKLVFSIRAKL